MVRISKCGKMRTGKNCVFVTISTKSSLIDIWQVPRYTSSVSEIIEKDTRENWSKIACLFKSEHVASSLFKKIHTGKQITTKVIGILVPSC